MVNRCVDIVVGLQAGSEGKGKVVSLIAEKYTALVRTGGPNAAHTVYYQGEPVSFHQIPCGALHAPNAKLVLGANAQIDIEYLMKEIEILKQYNMFNDHKYNQPRLIIDHQATVIDPVDKIAENGGRMPDCGELYFHPKDCDIHNNELGGTCLGCDKLPEDSAWAKLGSTTHGAGANLIRKIARGTKMATLPGDFEGKITLAKDHPQLKDFIDDTADYLNRLVDLGMPVLLEGTQGSVLSLHHGYYPKTTSRDTNASNWCSDAGISPLAIRDIYGVARTYPIRVAGNSGPMSGGEISWEEVTRRAGSKELIEEITTATKRRRRVFLFGDRDFMKAKNINRPTHYTLTFADYFNIKDFGVNKWDSLSKETKNSIEELEVKTGVHFNIVSTGPKTEHTIVRM